MPAGLFRPLVPVRFLSNNAGRSHGVRTQWAISWIPTTVTTSSSA
ncbi:hypothetical protein DM56_4398 [Burkholderia mallei]|nr:hypothetical protein DM75_3130 [Burkholderia mallei]KOS79001.1 hypothetical protein DM53_3431 [Burkholderia mallei]KOS94788.1 hypothetical protein DM45_3508 [Burkholderia mallei]KOS98225.1 hypothetical protein DM49_3500 [Burkholderia mallei]KOT11679.1 hypothetical protein DM56_4398 [Burkholderia mallei]